MDMKYYDKSLYKTEQHVTIILTILITFVIGFLIGYWCRGFENESNVQNDTVQEVQANTNNEANTSADNTSNDNVSNE